MNRPPTTNCLCAHGHVCVCVCVCDRILKLFPGEWQAYQRVCQHSLWHQHTDKYIFLHNSKADQRVLTALHCPGQVDVIFMLNSTLLKDFIMQTAWLVAPTAVSLKPNTQQSHWLFRERSKPPHACSDYILKLITLVTE